MSEMTAMRIASVATLTLLVVGAVFLLPWLWETEVPGELRLPDVRAEQVLTADEVERRRDHARFLRLAALGALVAQLAALLLLVRRTPSVRGVASVRAAQLGALVGATLYVAALPFRLTALWWQRRDGVVFLGYGRWLSEQLVPLAEFAVVGALAGVVGVILARRVGRHWWIPASMAVAAIGVAVILAQPLLTPRLDPLQRPTLTRAIAGLAERQGLEAPRVEIKRAAERTRIINAAALGVGPTTRLVFWDTALSLPEPELRVLAAHELAHVARRHLWKGLVWFALLSVPAVFLISRLVRLDDPTQIPRAALVAAVLALAATPFANTLSRRYEAEADWVALETTRDPEAAGQLLLNLAAASLGDPEPPFWSRHLFGTHPTLLERLALSRAFSARAEAALATPTVRARGSSARRSEMTSRNVRTGLSAREAAPRGGS